MKRREELAELSSLEESVYRMKNGNGINEDKPLKKKSDDPEILSILLRIEKEIFYKALLRKKS